MINYAWILTSVLEFQETPLAPDYSSEIKRREAEHNMLERVNQLSATASTDY